MSVLSSTLASCVSKLTESRTFTKGKIPSETSISISCSFLLHFIEFPANLTVETMILLDALMYTLSRGCFEKKAIDTSPENFFALFCFCKISFPKVKLSEYFSRSWANPKFDYLLKCTSASPLYHKLCQHERNTG